MRPNLIRYTHRSTGQTILVCKFQGYYEDEEELAFLLPNGKVLPEGKFNQLYLKTEHED